MFQSNGNRYFRLIIIALVMESAWLGAATSKAWDTFCKQPGMEYFRGALYTCCQQTIMNNTVIDTMQNRQMCSEAMKEVDGDDFLTSLYRRHLCLVKTTGATTDDLKTLQNYLKFITQHYDESIKTSIMQNSEQCEASDTEKDELKRFISFHDCFLRTEAKVCQWPNNEAKTIALKAVFSQDYCNEKVSTPTEGYCCKGKMTPVDFRSLDIYSKLNNSQSLSSRKCMASFDHVQRELMSNSSKSGAGGSVNKTSSGAEKIKVFCYSACNFRQANFTSVEDLKLNLEIMKASMFPEFSKTLRNELLLIFDKFGTEKVQLTSNNSSMSISDAGKLMLSLDSLSHIEIYCRLYDSMLFLPYDVLNEYCYGDELTGSRTVQIKFLSWLLSDISKKSGMGI